MKKGWIKISLSKLILDYKTKKFDLINYKKKQKDVKNNYALIVILQDSIYKISMSRLETYESVMKNILKSMKIKDIYLDKNWAFDLSRKFNCIIIKSSENFDNVYIPDNINDYQLEKLKKYNDEFKESNDLLNSKRYINFLKLMDNKKVFYKMCNNLDFQLCQKVKKYR